MITKLMKTKELKFFDCKGLVLYIIEKLINLIQYPFIETSQKIHQRAEQANFRNKSSQKKNLTTVLGCLLQNN